MGESLWKWSLVGSLLAKDIRFLPLAAAKLNRAEPYEKPPKSDEDVNFCQAFAVQDVETDQLPKG